jgi:ribosomal protein S18 acetylase RimI-like enzyme
VPERDAVPGTPTGELHALYADPARLGQGAGAAAHEAGLAQLRAAGYTYLVLWVFSDNRRARSFYARRGWRRDDAELTYYGERGGPTAAAVRYSRPTVTSRAATSSPR